MVSLDFLTNLNSKHSGMMDQSGDQMKRWCSQSFGKTAFEFVPFGQGYQARGHYVLSRLGSFRCVVVARLLTIAQKTEVNDRVKGQVFDT